MTPYYSLKPLQMESFRPIFLLQCIFPEVAQPSSVTSRSLLSQAVAYKRNEAILNAPYISSPSSSSSQVFSFRASPSSTSQSQQHAKAPTPRSNMMAIITFPKNITINLPPSISPSLSQTLLGITSLQSLLPLLLSPFLAIISYLCHTISLFIRITLFALRTELTLPVVWSTESNILEQVLVPIAMGGSLFWLAFAFILVFTIRSLFRAILKSPCWVLDPHISDFGCRAHELKLCKCVLRKLGRAKRSQSQEEKHTTTKITQTQPQPLTRTSPRFQHLPRITLPRLLRTEEFSQPSKKDPTVPPHRDPDNADILNTGSTGSQTAPEDSALT